MNTIRVIQSDGCTFEELIRFIDKCKENNLPLDTPVKISQHTIETLNDVVDMQADEESIIFYDWL